MLFTLKSKYSENTDEFLVFLAFLFRIIFSSNFLLLVGRLGRCLVWEVQLVVAM